MDATRPPSKPRWWPKAVAALVALVVAALLVMLVRQLGKPGAPQRQVARVTLLPDTPPPPPPPPKQDKPPQPKEQPRQTARPDEPKPAEAPKPEPLKMEGPTGDRPSDFAGGAVKDDYRGGPVAASAAGSGGSGTGSDRAQERFYVNAARPLLLQEIERRYRGDAAQFVAVFKLWIGGDGAIQRYELQPSGDARVDGDLRLVLDQTARELRLPPSPPVVQPMRFRLSVRPAG